MSSIAKYFATLRDWKQLPAYKAETRVDSIIGFALPQLLKHTRDLKVTTVIPELPLRIGSVQPRHAAEAFANKSYKVDFFVVTECGRNILIEFKTDSGSRRGKQDDYLNDAQNEGLDSVVSGVVTLLGATTYKKKYRHLIGKLIESGLLEADGEEFRLTVQNSKLDILYIQPHVKAGDDPESVIDFEAVAESLEAQFPGDEFMLEAAGSFREWYAD